MAGVATPSVDDSLATMLLPAVLSVVAGSVDAISFLGLGGLFAAHITGNLVVLAAHVVSGNAAGVAQMLSVPVFVVMVGLARVLAKGLEAAGVPSLRSLLLLQFLLLAGFLALSAAIGPRVDPGAAGAIFAGMLGVAAMAVQNALTQVALRNAPVTAVMTTNVTRFTMDLAAMLLGGDPGAIAEARGHARRTWPAIVGFAVGCALGAACEAAFGLKSLALPTGLALFALMLGLMAGSGAARKAGAG